MSKLFSIQISDKGENWEVYIGSRWRAWIFFKLFDFEIWPPSSTKREK